MRIDRWNANTLRRYHLKSGAIAVSRADRSCVVIPAFCRHISVPVDRKTVADQLRLERRAT